MTKTLHILHNYSTAYITSIIFLACVFFAVTTQSSFAYSVPYIYAEHSYISSYSQGGYGGGQQYQGGQCISSCGGYAAAERGYITVYGDGTYSYVYDGTRGGGGGLGRGGGGGGPECTIEWERQGWCRWYSQASYGPTYAQSGYIDPDDPISDTDPDVNLYIRVQGDTGWVKTTTMTVGEELSLSWQTRNVTSCESADTTEFTVPGGLGVSASTNSVLEPTTSARTYEIVCTDGTRSIRSSARATLDGGTSDLTLSALSLTATPSIVRKNEISILAWDTGGRTGCALKKSLANETPYEVPTQTGVRDSEPITGETTYTLSCSDGANDSVVIKMLPTISET
jgi:hypothetical protein